MVINAAFWDFYTIYTARTKSTFDEGEGEISAESYMSTEG